MTRSENVSIDGMEELIKQLQKIGADVEEEVKAILKPAGEYLKEEIKKEAVSLDDHYESENNRKYGLLSENIWMEWDAKNKTTYITTGNGFWATFIEYGTRGVSKDAVNLRLGTSLRPRPNKGVAAKPFMEPTYNRSKKQLEDIIAREIKKRVER